VIKHKPNISFTHNARAETDMSSSCPQMEFGSSKPKEKLDEVYILEA